MAKKDIQQELVRISVAPPPCSSIKQVDDVFILITQAFCPNGHNLVSEQNELFDGYPGIKLKLNAEDIKDEIIYVSPFQGDKSKKGKLDWKDGTKLDIKCPHCDISLPFIAKCNCESSDGQVGQLLKLYLTPALSDADILVLCNIWGCSKSKIIDNWNIISEYFEGHISE